MGRRTKRFENGWMLFKKRTSKIISKKKPAEIEENYETQMDFVDEEDRELEDFKEKITVNDVSDLFELCKSYCPTKHLSVLLYLTMRYFGISCCECDQFLSEIGALKNKTCLKRARIFLSGDLDDFCLDGRGGKRGQDFYDMFPEIETNAKLFTLEKCSEKTADFTALQLANYIDELH
ncbi:unnamed protein product [Didymodactylos carnosus]|uniref:Uncharacterized protein n=1 Tax=Didymodactylos carnosus TaxID=1234261 RepID=A0A815ZVA2_9BILA|nr:unnamed protein product [Didymodactylos carnosus]CAF4458631.1 unnamed protein product [Didymodactylos carnosus]